MSTMFKAQQESKKDTIVMSKVQTFKSHVILADAEKLIADPFEAWVQLHHYILQPIDGAVKQASVVYAAEARSAIGFVANVVVYTTGTVVHTRISRETIDAELAENAILDAEEGIKASA